MFFTIPTLLSSSWHPAVKDAATGESYNELRGSLGFVISCKSVECIDMRDGDDHDLPRKLGSPSLSKSPVLPERRIISLVGSPTCLGRRILVTRFVEPLDLAASGSTSAAVVRRVYPTSGANLLMMMLIQ